MSARERSLQAHAAAAGVDPRPEPPKPRGPRYVVTPATVEYEAGQPESLPVVFDTRTGLIIKGFQPADVELAKDYVRDLNESAKRARARALDPVVNEAASRGEVIKIGKRTAVVLEVRGLDAGFGYTCLWLRDQGKRLGDPTYTTALAPIKPIGRWTGTLREGVAGITQVYEQPTTNQKEADMAKVKTKAKKPAAKKAAEENGSEPVRRTREDLDALVNEFVSHLQSGGKMKDLKAEYGFSDDSPIRSALYRNGYDAKGNEHDVEGDSIDASKAAGKKQLAKLRTEGEPWYALAYRAGLSEGQVKKLVIEVGGQSTGRVYPEKPEEPLPAIAKPKGKAKKKPAARKGGKATKANPS